MTWCLSSVSDSDSEESSMDGKEDVTAGKVASPMRIMEFPKADDGMSSKDEEEISHSPQSMPYVDDLDDFLANSEKDAQIEALLNESEANLGDLDSLNIDMDESLKGDDKKDDDDEEKMFTDSEEEKPELKKEDLDFDINLALKDDDESIEEDKNSEPPIIDKEVSDKEDEPMPEVKPKKDEVKEKIEEPEKKEIKPKSKKKERSRRRQSVEGKKEMGPPEVPVENPLAADEERMIREIVEQLDREDEEKATRERKEREAKDKEEEKKEKKVKDKKEKGKGKGGEKKGKGEKAKQKSGEVKTEPSEKEKTSENEKKKTKKKVKKKSEEKEVEKCVEEVKSEVLEKAVVIVEEIKVGAESKTMKAEPSVLPPGEEATTKEEPPVLPVPEWRPIPPAVEPFPAPISSMGEHDALTAMADVAAAAAAARDEEAEQLADDEDSQEPLLPILPSNSTLPATSDMPLPSGARGESKDSPHKPMSSSSLMPTATCASSMLLDNTPPDTPEHSVSSHDGNSPHSQDESVSLRSEGEGEPEVVTQKHMLATPGGESPNFDISTHSSSGSSGNVPSSESSGESYMMAAKHKSDADGEPVVPSKKKKKGHKRLATGEKVKSTHKHTSKSYVTTINQSQTLRKSHIPFAPQ